MPGKVAVVSGSNKGVGFGIVRGLCKNFEGDVYLTARNEELGRAAVAELGKEGLSPKFHQLDITDVASINRLRDFLKQEYGGIDVLVNNAGIGTPSDKSFAEQARIIVKTNFTGTLDMCKAMFPILRPSARVVNVSSMSCRPAFNKCSKELQKTLEALEAVQQVEQWMAKFVDAAKAGTHEADGWPPSSAYGISKLGVTLMSYIQQKDIDRSSAESDIIVNACCPGWVDTDLSHHQGKKTIDQGADTPVYLALLPPNTPSPRGEIVEDRIIQHHSKKL